MAITALAPWFGSNRMLAEKVGSVMGKQKWIGVPFAGGMTELRYLDAPTIVVSDLHRNVINLARVVSNPETCRYLVHDLNRTVFHPDTLASSQKWFKVGFKPACDEDIDAAYHYFICAWMGRSAKAGTDTEFTGSLPARWNGNGGDSCTRYRSAIKSLGEWSALFKRCNFHTMDAFKFLMQVKDEPKHGVYCDPPFPGAGDVYLHKFTISQQQKLATKLQSFKHVRVVCRFYDHELIRDLYPKTIWSWIYLEGRKQSNAKGPEVLITRN